jgi:predicted dehydrogenase
MKKKICIIGYGYWGKILHKNINNEELYDIKILDDVLNNMNELSDKFDYYFISTPFLTHFDILKKICQFKNKKIWCEKPLVRTVDEYYDIFNLNITNKNLMMVDWVYTFNPCIEFLKNKLQNKKIKQIILNRTNDGPKRNDCNSIYDLSSHDLSILFYLFPEKKFSFEFHEFSVKNNENFGSNISWSYTDGTQIIINSSWQHKNKNRISFFITNEDEILIFDDIKKTVIIDNKIFDFSELNSPLESAMKTFFDKEDFSENLNITLKIIQTLENYENKV